RDYVSRLAGGRRDRRLESERQRRPFGDHYGIGLPEAQDLVRALVFVRLRGAARSLAAGEERRREHDQDWIAASHDSPFSSCAIRTHRQLTRPFDSPG